jgi:hypothetical protein
MQFKGSWPAIAARFAQLRRNLFNCEKWADGNIVRA